MPVWAAAVRLLTSVCAARGLLCALGFRLASRANTTCSCVTRLVAWLWLQMLVADVFLAENACVNGMIAESRVESD